MATASGMTGASQGFMGSMQHMQKHMRVKPSGNADRDFTAMMVPHHHGAVEMAKIELRYGRNPMLRKMAAEIIRSQTQEIGQLRSWLSKHRK